MKKFTLAALLSLCATFSTSLLFAQGTNPLAVCFTDDKGQTYHLSLYQGGKKGCHTAIGVVRLEKHRDGFTDGTQNMQDRCWPVIGDGCFLNEGGSESGQVHFVAYNPARDNCASDPDSIVYNGTMTWDRSSGAISGSGTYADYCAGNVESEGQWTATGPCDDMKPVMQSNNSFGFSVVPNPANSSSAISYALNQKSQVSITIYNFNNQVVKAFQTQTQAAGNYSTSWNLTNTAGQKVGAGLYKVVVNVNGKQYSKTLQVL